MIEVIGRAGCSPLPIPQFDAAARLVQMAINAIQYNAPSVYLLSGLFNRIDTAAMLLLLDPQYYVYIPCQSEEARPPYCNGPFEPLAAALAAGAHPNDEVVVYARERYLDVIDAMGLRGQRTARIHSHNCGVADAARAAVDAVGLYDYAKEIDMVVNANPRRFIEEVGEDKFHLWLALGLIDVRNNVTLTRKASTLLYLAQRSA